MTETPAPSSAAADATNGTGATGATDASAAAGATDATAATGATTAAATGPIRVAVNLLWCVPGEVGGSEEYLARQLAGLAEVDPDMARAAPTLFTLPRYAAAHTDLAARFPVEAAPTDGRRRSARVAAEHTWLARRSAGFDLVHHGGGTSPEVGRRPTLLTVHDLQFLEHPEYVSPAKLRYLRFVVPRSVARAAAVAVPSEFVRDTVIEAYHVDPERVVVVPHGIERRARSAEVDEASLRTRLGLGNRPFVVYPAITHPHKNHRLLLDVMHRHWTEPDLRLVLLGGRGAVADDVERRIVELGLGDRVVQPGRVPDADRDALLAAADAMVFPSTYEGFGAPLIEAMSAGTPVVCGDHPTMRGVVGDAAVVLPGEPDAWATALSTVRDRRDELVAAGHERAARFSLAASASALLDAYERAVAIGAGRSTRSSRRGAR